MCTPAPPSTRECALFVTTAAGLSVLAESDNVITGPVAVTASTPDFSHCVTAEAAGAGTKVSVRDLATGQVHAESVLTGQLEPRIVSPDANWSPW